MTNEKESSNFIHSIIERDIKEGKNEARVHTRFPPEPNGYLHIGHAKSICLNFSTAQKYHGFCNLRFDDTNPEKEETEYVESIKNDIEWLGFKWQKEELFTSNYFGQLHKYAVELIKKGKAFVDDSSAEEISQMRGTPTRAGDESPYRNRSIDKNLNLFEMMKSGEFEEGTKILRAKINMSSPNMHLRDPAIYRIKKASHHRTGDQWCIYPMYDFAHGLSDSIEGITHSLCTLEFEVHRALYDWLIEQLNIFHPQQIEFARLNLTYTVMSKRKLLELVNLGYVNGWDDPRMPTISGLRRRGYTAEAIRFFSESIGIAKRDGIIEVEKLEHSIRRDLNKKANRVLGVLNPVKVIIENYPEGQEEPLPAIDNPENPDASSRMLTFGNEIYIEKESFMENPPSPRKFFGLSLNRFVRLKYAYIIKCIGYEKDKNGEVSLIRCEYFPESKSGSDTSGIKVKTALHWVNANTGIKAEIRLYEKIIYC